MYAADAPEPDPRSELSLPAIATAIAGVAAGLDARFVTAGEALAQAHGIVERLVTELEGVTNALGAEAAGAAITNLRATADRLERLPMVQASRREGLERIAGGAQPLRHHIAQVMRTLDFLRICGLNIRVAAGGRNGFSTFADTMSARLDVGEREIAGIGTEVEQLIASIPALIAVDRQLAEECGRVIPQVPRKLAADAAALQSRQAEDAARAARIAEIARDIRAKVGRAIGAMQIGDITRQRLEHIAAGLHAVIDLRQHADDTIDPAAILQASGHAIALLAAQAADAIAAFHREAQQLAQSLAGIAPSTAALLDIRAQGAQAGPGDDKAAFLAALEQSVAEVGAVTTKLRDADARAQGLAAATSDSAARLAERLRIVHRVNEDVHLMAWNTDLRCHRLGDEGKALAMVAAEIRTFATTLARISGAIRDSVETLVGAVAALRDPDADPGVDPGAALTASLACIHAGAERMRDGMAQLDSHADEVTRIVDRTSRTIDCEAEFGETLRTAADQLALLGMRCDAPDAETTALLAPMLDQLARSYTMAEERMVHLQFALPADEHGEADDAGDGAGAAPDPGDEDDDGLF